MHKSKKTAEKIEFISTILDKLYPEPKAPLTYTDPFSLLIAVVLSAQCTDKVVNSVMPALMAKANTPQKMAKLSEKNIFALIKRCGLAKSKSGYLCALSKMLVEKYEGKIPASFEDLETLPGVGHKTAGVVLSHAFGIPAFPVDTHIHRLSFRWGLSDGSSVVQTEKCLKKIFPQNEWLKRHLQMIYFGREYCKARGHNSEECPICSKIA